MRSTVALALARRRVADQTSISFSGLGRIHSPQSRDVNALATRSAIARLRLCRVVNIDVALQREDGRVPAVDADIVQAEPRNLAKELVEWRHEPIPFLD